MAQLSQSSTFVKWELTPREELQGSVLSIPQKQVIQNEIEAIANQILGLQFDATDPSKFIQDDSFLKGRLNAYQSLLLRSEDALIQLQSYQSNDEN